MTKSKATVKKTKKTIKKPLIETVSSQTLKFLSIIIGFSEALVIYIASTFFQEVSGRSDVGIFYVAIYVIFLIILLNLHKVVRLVGKTRILTWSFIGQIVVIFSLLFFDNTVIRLISMIFFLLFDQMLLVSLDIILDACTPDGEAGRARGSHLTILNIGFIVGPKISTWLLSSFSFGLVFVVVLFFKIIALTVAWFKLGYINHVHIRRESVGQLVNKALANQDVRRIYFVSFALEFFYALMIIYSPIYLESIGLSIRQIGTIFTIMLIPFIFIEYPIGWLADKRLGEKEMIVFFLGWMAVATTVVYTLERPIVWIWAIALLATRIGAASIEALRDSYFYKKISDDDVDLIDFFRTARPVAYIVAAALSVFVVHFFSVPEIFLLAALVLFAALVPAARLRDNLSESEQLVSKKKGKPVLVESSELEYE